VYRILDPYQELPHPSRYLVAQLLNIDIPVVKYQENGWGNKVRENLSSRYQTVVVCEQDKIDECKQSLLEIIIDPIEVGFQVLYPMIENISRKNQAWHVSVVVKELLGG
jgi:hypothetical protein